MNMNIIPIIPVVRTIPIPKDGTVLFKNLKIILSQFHFINKK